MGRNGIERAVDETDTGEWIEARRVMETAGDAVVLCTE